MRILDLHTHGLDGYDTRTTNPDDILKMAELHGSQGVTDIVPTVYPGPIETMRQHMKAVKGGMGTQRTALTNSRFKIQDSQFARIAGIHLEGPFLNPIRAGALDKASFQKPSEKTWNRLIEGFEDIVRIVTIAPELEGAPKLIETISNSGIKVNMGHSDATYKEAEEGFRAGAAGITHLFNAMRGMHHRGPGIAGFGLINPDIYVEVIADPFHLDDRTMELIFKVKKPDKIIIISDSVKETPINVKNHAIQNHSGTLQGGSLTITESAKRLIGLGFDEARIIDCISANPWSYLSSGE
jgi:N-acetylglucosamine-6-phosphate deacetylase